jgi:hypothetical protein
MLNSTGDEMRTDGNLTVVHLKGCAMPVMQYSWNTPLIPVRPHNRFVRYLRTRVLLYKERRHSRKHRLQRIRPFSDEHSFNAPPLLHSERRRL